MRNSDALKTLEDYEILLKEIVAYRELDSAEFDFNGEVLRNTGECGLGSEDAYYKMDILSLKEAISYYGIDKEPKPRKRKTKLNRYKRKMYHKKYKHLKRLRMIETNSIRAIKPGSEKFPLNGGGYRKV